MALTDPTGAVAVMAAGAGGTTTPAPTGDQPQGPNPEDVAKAQQLQNKSMLDVVLEAGGQILMEILGINDIISCLKGDIGACVMTVIGALPWGKIFKAKKIAEALWKAGRAIFKFFEELKWAKAILRGAERAAEAAKAAAAAAAKAAADRAAAIKAAAERAAKKVADDAAARAKALAAKAKAATKKGAGKAEDAADDVAGSCPTMPHSFVAGTRVRLADGTNKPIEQTQPGDTVLATDPITGQTEARQVTHTIRTDDDKQFVDLTVRGGDSGTGSTLTTTEHHPFWSVTQGRWVDAGKLQPGELLRTSAGSYVQLGAVRRYHAERPTYDLTVDGVHTYYVVAGGTTVLVHNCNLTYVTYTKTNPVTGEVYSGRTMGYGDPAAIVAARDAGHHMNASGFGPAVVDRYMDAALPYSARHSDLAYQAIRGREQNLIDFFGGAKVAGGSSGNAIRGIMEGNPLRATYMHAARRIFGLL